MAFFPVAFALAFNALFWGAGLASLATPFPWRRWWPVFCAPAGLALQSAAVWFGAHSSLAGTDAYGRWSELIPLVLLGAAVWRRGASSMISDLARWRGLGCLMALGLCILMIPMALSSPVLTTSSLGSCDAADYAAGARVFKEFASGDRSGFLGLAEVVKVASSDNFVDFWLRLNHFTPSALIALNGSVLGLDPHELTGVLTGVLLMLSLPMVFWMARAVLGYSPAVSLWISALYALSPLTWYAVAQVATAQLLAAQAIALVTWAGVALWRGPLTWRRGWGMGGMLFVAYWLILGSYNFIILVCLVPAVAFAGFPAFRARAWGRLGIWLLFMLLPLAACSTLFVGRVSGLVERFALFQAFDFGWRIPAMSPEGWFGALAGPGLDPFWGGLRLGLSLLLVALLLVSLVAGSGRRPRFARLALCLVLPVLAGYAFLQMRGATAGTNASYDAYKLFAVFYPGILCGLCFWTTLLGKRGSPARLAAASAVVIVSGFNLAEAWRFASAMSRPPLSVGPGLAQLKAIESMPDVASLNMRIPDMWSRLWANAFLLRKPQYFEIHTYEGRLNTPLRGDWDLNGGILQLRLPGGATRVINGEFSLSDTRASTFVRASLGSGWHELERQSRSSHPLWRWTAAQVQIRLESRHSTPMKAVLRIRDVRSLASGRDLSIHFGQHSQFQPTDGVLASVAVGEDWKEIGPIEIELAPGGNTVTLGTKAMLTRPRGSDPRLLGFQVSGIEIEVLEGARATDIGP